MERKHPFPGNGLEKAEIYEGTGPYEGELKENRIFWGIEGANLLSSQMVDIFPGYTMGGEPAILQTARYEVFDEKYEAVHRPVLDIDMPVKVVPSSTEGHYHLYIDKPMPWSTYTKLLDALAEAGILQKGYVEASKRRGATHVRLPWIKKKQNWKDDLNGIEG